MTTFTVKESKRYRATLSLGLIERFATNETIAERLRFTDVIVTGAGASRMAEAVWPGADASAELPRQIVDVVEL